MQSASPLCGCSNRPAKESDEDDGADPPGRTARVPHPPAHRTGRSGRNQVRAATCARDAAASLDVAALLASQLVSAIRREAADTATLATGCGPG